MRWPSRKQYCLQSSYTLRPCVLLMECIVYGPRPYVVKTPSRYSSTMVTTRMLLYSLSRRTSRIGLPLSLADRSAAAARIARSHPQWSDRMIAMTAGLSPKTIGAIRQRSTQEIPQLNKRVGGDGRARPVDSAEGRRIAGDLLTNNPRATLRAVADEAGISPATVRDVRERLRRGERPELPRRPGPTPRNDGAKSETIAGRSVGGVRRSILPQLSKDPSLRFNEAGRALLRLLDANTIEPDEWDRLIDSVPTHCASMIADAAKECAEAWRRVATQIKHRGSVSM